MNHLTSFLRTGLNHLTSFLRTGAGMGGCKEESVSETMLRESEEGVVNGECGIGDLETCREKNEGNGTARGRVARA